MQVVVQHSYAEQVLAPLSGDVAMGPKLEDDVALEFLENEIMKVGSLAHTEIDWQKVESEALKILSDRSKDLRVLGFLMLGLQRGGDGERFALSLYLLQQVLENWWDQAWPYPGDRGKRARTMMFSQMLQRSGKHAAGLSFDSSVGDGREFCLELIEQLLARAVDLQLPQDPIGDLRRAVEKLPKASESAPAGSQPSHTETPAPASTERPVQTAVPSLGALTLDPGNERATRQSLLKVADLLTNSTPDSALGYRVRRYAIWHGIVSVPPTRDEVRTDLAAVSPDRVAGYRECLDKAPDADLWQRIEQSLSVSPFWLDGHWFSARTASALGYEACAQAIREDVKAFVERLPKLTELAFNDGTPFLGGEAADWLWAAPAGNGGKGASANPWELAFDQARELVSKNALPAAMQLMDEGLAEAREPRDRFYWRLTNAQVLKEAGLGALATQQIADLHSQVQELALNEWEPALIRQLDRLA